ncbi:hypothetical protein OC834_006159 [Tilletia horrida]|nr:hypothetical protein OC834_006159 [Tilletia horrida]
MRRSSCYLVFIFVFALHTSLTSASSPCRSSSPGPFSSATSICASPPRHFFVEFQQQDEQPPRSVWDAGERVQRRDQLHSDFHSYLATRNISYQQRYSFANPGLILGASLELDDPGDVAILREFPGAKKVRRVGFYRSPGKFDQQSTDPLSENDASSSPSSSEPLATLVNSTLAGLQAILSGASSQSASIGGILQMIGADLLHAQGHFGRGQTIAVIDTGIDYTHHALNGGQPDGTPCFGEGCPVLKGYSFANDAGKLVNSSNPFANCLNGWHGTATAGLLIASAPDRNFTGVVPEAQVAAYRIFGCTPSDTPDDVIMSAMQKAYEDGADIISMSVGRTASWQDQSPVSLLATRLSDLGVHMVISGGNLGRFGGFQAEAPENTPRVYSVGSVQPEFVAGYTATIKSSEADKEIVYFAPNPIAYNETAVFPIYATSHDLDPLADACAALPSSTPNLTLSAVLIAQSPQRNSAMAAGGKIILSYGRSDSSFLSASDGSGRGIQMVALTHDAGVVIKELVQKGDRVSIDFSRPRAVELRNEHYGGYGMSDGTSFSTPLVAGAVALYRSIKGKAESPDELRRVFTSTAVPVLSPAGDDVLDTVARSGGGMISVHNAIHSTTRVSIDHIALNDSRHFAGPQQVTITNIGNATQTFKMEHQPAGTVRMLDGSPSFVFRKGFLVPVQDQQATVRFTPARFSLGPGEQGTVSVDVRAPASSQKDLPVYSGFAIARSDQPHGSVSVPYMGVAADMSAYPIFSTTQPPGLYDGNGTRVEQDGRVFSLAAKGDAPSVRFWLLLGTQYSDAYLVRANTSYVPTLPTFPGRPDAGPCTTSHRRPLSPDDVILTIQRDHFFDRSLNDPQIQNYGTIDVTVNMTDSSGNAHIVRDGEYRILVRMLKIFGDPGQESSFQSYLSPSFRSSDTSRRRPGPAALEIADSVGSATFFVEFERPEDVSPRDQERKESHDKLHLQLHDYLTAVHKIPYRHRFSFTNPKLVLGMSLELQDPSHIQALHAFPHTKKVHRVRSHYNPNAGSDRLSRRSLSASELLPFTPSRSCQRNPTGGLLAKPADQPMFLAEMDTTGALRMISADKLHDKGHFGHGQNIAIIDSGIDYTHHALNGGKPDGTPCFGDGCPIFTGYSFRNDAGDMVNSSDPFADCLNGWHGTATAGLLIASAPDRNFTGITPQASIAAYRAFGCHFRDTPDDLIMSAMQKAYEDGAEIISMSLGRTASWQDQSPASALATRLSDLGVHMVISGGNLGHFGGFQAESPSNTPRVYSVGSVQSAVVPGYTATIKGDGLHREIVYLAANPVRLNETSSFPIFATTAQLNPDADACDSLPASTPNLTHSAVLIAQCAQCWPAGQRNTAMAAGGKIILSYGRRENSMLSASDGDGQGIQAVDISHEDGIFLKKLINAGHRVSIDFSDPRPVSVHDEVYGGRASNFSQVGPAWDLHFSTFFSAPGGEVFSTWPVNLGSYGTSDGTSFATPLAAGAVALYRSIKGMTESPEELRRIFTTTATPVLSPAGGGVLDTVARSGGGMINVYKAINCPTRVSTDNLALNDSRHFTGSQQLTITNVGNATQGFELTHRPAGTLRLMDGAPDFHFLQGPLVPINDQQAAVRITPDRFSLAPGTSQAVQIDITPPASDLVNLPIYSGFVSATSDQPYGSINVPYLGVAADMGAYPVFEVRRPPALYDGKGNMVKEDGRVFNLTDGDVPTVRWWTLLGALALDGYLMHANTSYVATLPPVPGVQRDRRATAGDLLPEGIISKIQNYRFVDRSLAEGDADPAYGTTEFQADFVDDDGVRHIAQDGHYRILVRGSRFFSDLDQVSSFDTYLSPIFEVRLPPKNSTLSD